MTFPKFLPAQVWHFRFPPMKLVWPSVDFLPGYIEALERGWSADTIRGDEAAREELALIQTDPAAFVAGLVYRDPKGGLITLPDGTRVPRLPGYRKWMWDSGFCGSIGFRWQPGTTSLPPHCLGHIGYAVVPWKQRLGYATQALRLLLPEAKKEGLAFVELVTDPGNLASRRVIETNGGLLVESFVKPESYGGKTGLRYRIPL